MEIVFSFLDPLPSSLYNADTEADLDVFTYGLVFRMVKECTDSDVEGGIVPYNNSIESAIRVFIIVLISLIQYKSVSFCVFV